MRATLDLHDFSVVNNRLLWLLGLKQHFPNFKVSLFTVPFDKKEDWGPSLIGDDFLIEIKKNLDWIQLIPHGLYHNGSEMSNYDYSTFKEKIMPEITDAFDSKGLPYVKGFCAPHWRWTDGVVKALDEAGWWGAVDRDKQMPYTKRYYRYNFLLNEPFWESKEDLKLHGHIYGTKNDIGRCFDNLLKLPKDTEWVFVSDCLESL